jgi:hypothetical protein
MVSAAWIPAPCAAFIVWRLSITVQESASRS